MTLSVVERVMSELRKKCNHFVVDGNPMMSGIDENEEETVGLSGKRLLAHSCTCTCVRSSFRIWHAVEQVSAEKGGPYHYQQSSLLESST